MSALCVLLVTVGTPQQQQVCMLIVGCNVQNTLNFRVLPPEGITGIQTASGVLPWPRTARELLAAIASYQEPSGDAAGQDHGKDGAEDDAEDHAQADAEVDAEAGAEDDAGDDAEQGERNAMQGEQHARQEETVRLNHKLLHALCCKLSRVMVQSSCTDYENLYSHLRMCKIEVEGLGDRFAAALRDPPPGDSVHMWTRQLHHALWHGFCSEVWSLKTRAQMAQLLRDEADSMLMNKLDEVAEVWLGVTCIEGSTIRMSLQPLLVVCMFAAGWATATAVILYA